jgi:glycyl-tRNA synthetase
MRKNSRGDILFIEGALLAPHAVWEASGHIQNFQDPLIDCLTCKHRFRADDVDLAKPCPVCGNTTWTDVRQFNLMFSTQLGAATDSSSIAYLRPETAQSIFINFKNVMSSNRVKIPFGIAQVGKAFRNEITPKQFLFRMREFEQMEMEWFCTDKQAPEFFTWWSEQRTQFYTTLGIKPDKIRVRPHTKEELSHYSSSTSDIEYQFPFGWKELEGIAYRGNFDLTQHMKFSGKDLSIYDETNKTSFVPHVVECSVGTDRLFLTILFDAYEEEIIEGEVRTVLHLAPQLAPYTIAFFPLTKQQVEPAHKLVQEFKNKGYSVQYDLAGSIGKRYRRQDEIGTPFCVTYDFDSPKDSCVTVRHRDTMLQERVSLDTLEVYITQKMVS